MRIEIKLDQGTDYKLSENEAGEPTLVIETWRPPQIDRCFTGLGIKTDQGLFGIAMRDDGIEVMLDGEIVWSSTSMLGNAPVSDEAKAEAWRVCVASDVARAPRAEGEPEGGRIDNKVRPD